MPVPCGPRIGRSVSLDQAAAFLQVSRRTIYNWIRAGRLSTIRTLGGASQRVLTESLLRVLGERAGQGDPPAAFPGSSSN